MSAAAERIEAARREWVAAIYAADNSWLSSDERARLLCVANQKRAVLVSAVQQAKRGAK